MDRLFRWIIVGVAICFVCYCAMRVCAAVPGHGAEPTSSFARVS
ncbi:MAG TPA: hypothetical protein PKH51_04810 [Candidatus Sumerlaeota bacterium]|nr:hypothetical protein [Candidatus Sumerlaeota bacterium]HNM46320.1 hypothetical protein [Candidatus Sumerlaeota bacterium]